MSLGTGIAIAAGIIGLCAIIIWQPIAVVGLIIALGIMVFL